MKRYIIYFLVALITFGLTSFVIINLTKNKSTTDQNHIQKKPKIQINVETSSLESTPVGYGEATVKHSELRTKPPKVEQTEIICTDLSILSIWKKVVKDKEFQDRIDEYDGIIDCKKVIEVKQVDLNNDGNLEFVINGTGPRLCSATGSCGFWVFQKVSNKYKQLLSSSSYMGQTYSPKFENNIGKTKNYTNLFLQSHLRGGVTNYRTYKFNGKKYIERKCIIEHFFIGGKKEILSCREWKKR